MRITDTMVTNNILAGLNRNEEALAKYQEQLSSGNIISRPSEDPIIAARTLKLTSSLNEIDQYQTNVDDAENWLTTTEDAVDNVTDELQRINELAIQASSDTLTTDDRESIIEEIKELREQIASELNATYDGRYVFSGYQTGTSASFTEDTTADYEITETFSSSDVDTVEKVYDSDGDGNVEINEVQRIRLAYDDLDSYTGTDLTVDGTTYSVTTMSSTDTGAYEPGDDEVIFLEDTGELILGSNVATAIESMDEDTTISCTYEKSSFVEGDVRPEIYFDCTLTDDDGTTTSYSADEDVIEYDTSYNQTIAVNTEASDFVSTDLLRDLDEIIAAAENITDDGSDEDDLNQELLGDMFEDLITTTDTAIESNSSLNAQIGAKINRLDLTSSRLEDSESNLTELLSNTADVDTSETVVKYSAQEVIYNASLAAASKLVKSTLLDFLA